MNKNIIISALFISSLFLAGCNQQPIISESKAQEINQTVAKEDRIEIIGFHRIRRCATCLSMERNTKETLDKYFQKELENGDITFQSINIEESILESVELVNKYQATGSSIFVNKIQAGEDHIELDANAWKLARQDEKFQSYFKEKIDNLLK